MADLVIYELHVGTFTEAGTFDGVTGRLGYLRELGVTAIELMPVAEFSGVDTTGGVTGAWASEAIGVEQPSNDPGQLYVALEDTAGNVAVVNHPDATAMGATDWQQWLIPLSEFGGVNMTRVKMMYIGIGDRDNPSAGGTGLIFIDDIGYGHPVTVE